MKFSDYEDLRNGLRGLPATWYPDLIRILVQEAYKQKVFIKGGASTFVKTIEKER